MRRAVNAPDGVDTLTNASMSPADKRHGAIYRVADYLEYLLMLLVLLECNSMYAFAVQTAGRVNMDALFYLLAIPVALAALLLRLWLNPRKLRDALPNGIAIAALVACTVGFYLLNVRFQADWKRQIYIKGFLLFLPLMLALFKAKQREGRGLDLLFKYSDIVCALAALSLAVYLSSALDPANVQAEFIYSRWNNRNAITPLINMLDVCQAVPRVKWQMLNVMLLRNNGIFTEPLMFALPLLVALLTELFLRGKGDRWRGIKWALLTATLLTVNATIGLMLAAAAWGLKFLAVCVKRGKRWLVIPILVVAIAAGGLLVVEKTRSAYQSASNSGNSLSAHIDDYHASFKAFAEKPLLGIGFFNEEGIFANMQAYRLSNPGLSNTLGPILAEGGVTLGVLCLAPFLIWLLYLFRRRDWRVACWGLGALGVTVGIIFKYHMLLMAMIAFGYSLLDLSRVGGRVRLALVDPRGQGGETTADDPGRPRWLPLVVKLAVTAAVYAALAWFGRPIWTALHAFLRSHQFSVGQAPLRSLCFATALLFVGVSVRGALRGELTWLRIVLTLAWSAAYLALYPAIFSWVNTLLPLLGVWGELRECLLLLAIWMAPAALIMLVQPKRWLNRKGAILAGAAVAAIVAVALGSSFYIDRRADAEDALRPELEAIAEGASGKVYVNDLPLLYHRQVKGVDLPATRDSGYEVCKNASVVFEAGAECRELLDHGFQMAQLDDGHLLCTNDEGVVDALSARGTAFYPYNPFGREADLEPLAELNELELTDDGAAIVNGPIESLASGPFDVLYPGEYTVAYALHVDPEALAEVPADSLVCHAAVTRGLGSASLGERMAAPDTFDMHGDAVLEVSFSVDDIAKDVEYLLFGDADAPVEVRSIHVRQTPTHITRTDYNARRDAIWERYFNLDGTPLYIDGVYAILERDFDPVDRLVGLRYYDADGKPVLTNGGYFGVRYHFNRQGWPEYAEYYGPDGAPIMRNGGYAAVRWVFDAYGNKQSTIYYDTEGNPIG